MLNKTTITHWQSPKEVYTFYTESKPKKSINLTGAIGTIALTVLGIEETIFKNIIKLCWEVMSYGK